MLDIISAEVARDIPVLSQKRRNRNFAREVICGGMAFLKKIGKYTTIRRAVLSSGSDLGDGSGKRSLKVNASITVNMTQTRFVLDAGSIKACRGRMLDGKLTANGTIQKVLKRLLKCRRIRQVKKHQTRPDES